jgi:hypothetical protein
MPTSPRKPSPYERAGSAEINATVERVAPAIVAALAGRHDHQDVVRALIRLSVTGQVEETSGRYALGAAVAALP